MTRLIWEEIALRQLRGKVGAGVALWRVDVISEADKFIALRMADEPIPKRIFVGNFDFQTNESELLTTFQVRHE